MRSSRNAFRIGRLRATGAVLAAIAGFAVAALAGTALARTFTLGVAKGAKVVDANTGAVTQENIVTSSRGFALYTLSGDSKSHPKCVSSSCHMIWPAVTVSSRSKLTAAPGISGKLTLWRHGGHLQVLDAGHPLYMFAFDKHARIATGETIHSFGGTWHVVKAHVSTGTSPATSAPTTTTTPAPVPYY